MKPGGNYAASYPHRSDKTVVIQPPPPTSTRLLQPVSVEVRQVSTRSERTIVFTQETHLRSVSAWLVPYEYSFGLSSAMHGYAVSDFRSFFRWDAKAVACAITLGYSGVLPISAVVSNRFVTTDYALLPASLRVTSPRCEQIEIHATP